MTKPKKLHRLKKQPPTPNKKKRMISFLPRIFLFMFFITYFSGLLYTILDYIFFFIGLFVLSILLFFLPWNRVLNSIMKLEKEDSSNITISIIKKELNELTPEETKTPRDPNI